MKLPRFTPGPWRVLKGVKENSYFVTFHTRKDDNGHQYQRTDVAYILADPALDYDQTKTENYAEGLANANLIAQAPELYACCVLASVYIGNIIDRKFERSEPHQSEVDLLDTITKAMLKARGAIK